MTLFERVKNLAKQQGLSLLRLNDQAGLGKNAIYKWKTQTPSTENLQKVATVLGVTPDQLLEDGEKSTGTKKVVDIDDDTVLLSFDGKPIPEEDKELFKRLLRGK
ncbi:MULTISPECIES: helix-turn-helix domain-containing protein [Levilactobacillus]|uniref:Transcriptional regulator n=2 Tax=Levilactobacillus TaxID=2767886 RepID=M5B1H2_LEVBR|nr:MULTISPECIES: helix-turn-helix transcriptional regulator [Levilactobacillus]MDT7012827.1 helix-turn-helix transcriptional regulator [Levilactobacillus namurensis]MDT7015353.1 helix-turn-helix transcriptional regulator [Levilactobacillus namurensis]MDT7015579.1 helix-turn-helix transcriptional regulator [Levilactobacillus namurensis]BAN07811.1 transcriptional regulator [Levilactobacillus brevis KB290]HJE44436.1 helix-turn-helix domain-containing protein [Levilactobacillus namurensis]